MQNRYPVLKVLLLVFQIKSGPAMEITTITWAGCRKDIRRVNGDNNSLQGV